MKNKCINFAELAANIYESDHKKSIREYSKIKDLNDYCKLIDSLMRTDFMDGLYVWVNDKGNFEFEVIGPFDFDGANTSKELINNAISFECYINTHKNLSTVLEFPGIWKDENEQ